MQSGSISAKNKVKLLMLGDSGVGKSSILNRFTDDKFTPNFFTTLGVEYKQKTIDLKGRQVLLQIWDTAGQERFKTITPVYYKSVDGVVLVYDITDSKTFENVEYWLQNLSEHADRNKMSFVLAANKVDLPNRSITKQVGEDMAAKCAMQFYECSAKSSANISQMFSDITADIIEKRAANHSELDLADGLVLVSPQRQATRKKGCCD